MKKSILLSVLLIVLMLVIVLTGCPNSANTDPVTDPVTDPGLKITDAASLYKSLTGKDITKNVEPLVVVNAEGVQTIIEDSQLTSVRKARSAYNSRDVVNASSLGWHPLKKAVTTYAQSAELMCITQYSKTLDSLKLQPIYSSLYGSTVAQREEAYYFEDSKKEYNKINCTTPGDGSIFGVGDTYTIKGDFDGDGIDEILCMFIDTSAELDKQKYRYCIYNDGWQSIHELTETFFIAGLNMNTAGLSPGFAYDLDNDNCDELVIPSMHRIDDGKLLVDINVFRLNSDTLEKITFYTWELSNLQFLSITNMAAGDIDNDNIIEIVACVANSDISKITTAKTMFIWEYKSGSLTLSSNPDVSFVESSSNGCFVYIGDFFGNGENQVFCYQIYNNSGDPQVYVFDGKLNTAKVYSVPVKACDLTNKAPIIADFNIDCKMELATRSCIISFNASKEISTIDIPETTFLVNEAGDVDSNGRPDIVCLVPNKANPRAYGFSAAGEWVEVKEYQIGDTPSYINEGDFKYVLANIDDDSLRVKYVGHELKYSEPIPLYALAGAPYYKEIVENDKYGYSPDDWSTSIEKSTSNSDADANSLGFTVGASFGIETDAFFAKSNTEVNVEASFNHQWTNSMTVSEAITFDTGGSGDDYIIFTAIPIDIFNYEIIGVPVDCLETAPKVGSTVNISIPRKPGTYMTPISEYNKNNGELLDIDVFNHELGNPSSYPTESEAHKIVEKYDVQNILTFDIDAEQKWASYDVDKEPDKAANSKNPSSLAYFSKLQNLAIYDDEKDVISNPTTGITCEITKENGRVITAGGSVSVKQEVATGVGFANAKVGVEVGLTYEHEWSSDVSKGISFSGTVGNLPKTWANANPNKTYSQGMFVYPAQSIIYTDDNDNAKQQVFWVIDYFVE